VTDPGVVLDAAAAFLAVRPRSVEEVRRRLGDLGFQAGLVDASVTRLVELGYLADHAFARSWVESRDRARPLGVLALRQGLQRTGVARDVVDEILAERASASGQPTGDLAPDAELAAAAHLLSRRERALRRESDPRRRRQKAYALLARHGFTPDICRQAVLGAALAGTEPVDLEV
jgi:regulatory protein